MKERHIIAAVCDFRGIGLNNKLLFKIPADMKHFKELTLGNVVIMGRKTYESIGKPLNCRNNIVVTKKGIDISDNDVNNLFQVKSLDEAYELAEEIDGDKVFVIGGGQLYNEAINTVDYLDITEIAFLPKADTFFPDINVKDWVIKDRTERYFTEDIPPYRFVTYKRKVFPVVS